MRPKTGPHVVCASFWNITPVSPPVASQFTVRDITRNRGMKNGYESHGTVLKCYCRLASQEIPRPA